MLKICWTKKGVLKNKLCYFQILCLLQIIASMVKTVCDRANFTKVAFQNLKLHNFNKTNEDLLLTTLPRVPLLPITIVRPVALCKVTVMIQFMIKPSDFHKNFFVKIKITQLINTIFTINKKVAFCQIIKEIKSNNLKIRVNLIQETHL